MSNIHEKSHIYTSHNNRNKMINDPLGTKLTFNADKRMQTIFTENVDF